MLYVSPGTINYLRVAQSRFEEMERRRIAVRRAAAGRKLDKKRFDRFVDDVALVLKTGDQSKFRYEGACRHGVRRSLVLRSWSWHDADHAAAAVVETALRQIGAVRPTWYEGQPEFVGNTATQRYFCERCGKPLGEGRERYCDKFCSNAAYKERAAKFELRVSLAEYQAALAVRRENKLQACSNDCEGCGKPFIGSRPGTRYCSKECGDFHRRKHPSKPCAQCGTLFRPANRTKSGEMGKFCSRECTAISTRKTRPARACVHCAIEFIPKTEKQILCSRRCWSLKVNAERKSALRCEEVS